jgi:hypothetical protein|tara:strand:+ start:1220 stop:1429 length:210 start_codon:yes stop_codon:yes gene_type:complete
MEPQAQIITIIVYSDIDPSQLLEIANEAAERIAEDVETYGEDIHFLPEETSVEFSNNGGKEIVGGHQHA